MPSSRVDTGLLGEPGRSRYRARRLMRREFRASLMSDTKWRKLFTAIERLRLLLPVCRIKWVDAETPVELATPRRFDLHPPRPYVDSIFGPFALCSIEWLEFPRTVRRTHRNPNAPSGFVPLAPIAQDLDRAEQILKSVARFPMQNTQAGLRIIGHVR